MSTMNAQRPTVVAGFRRNPGTHEGPRQQGLYLGCFGSRLTFYSQQSRAFNLVWAMFSGGCLKAVDRVAIVGAGLAGITAAAAAIVRGARVTIFEQGTQRMGRQRGNFIRYIHPKILDWPHPGSDVARTAWDIMN